MRPRAHGGWFDKRETRAADGGARIIYVTQDLGVGGGHRVVFEHLGGLAERGHHPELWTLVKGPPDWYDLGVPIRSSKDYGELQDAMRLLDAIKVATWWETAMPVWEGSVRRGVPAYFVQDIETSYYSDADLHGKVLTTYRTEFEYLTTSPWVLSALLAHVPGATAVAPGVDTSRWFETGALRENAILALGRGNPLKNFPLTRAAYEGLAARPPLWLFGIEPAVAAGMGDTVTYHRKPSDAEINDLLTAARCSCRPPGTRGSAYRCWRRWRPGRPSCARTPTATRSARTASNCLMPADDPRAVREALEAVLGNPDLAGRLREGGRRTAQAYALPKKLDELDGFYRGLAERRASGVNR